MTATRNTDKRGVCDWLGPFCHANPAVYCGIVSVQAVRCVAFGDIKLAALQHRLDLKNQQYQQAIKQGDLVLNRLQKLAKVADVE